MRLRVQHPTKRDVAYTIHINGDDFVMTWRQESPKNILLRRSENYDIHFFNKRMDLTFQLFIS